MKIQIINCLLLLYLFAGCSKKVMPEPEPEVSFTIQNDECTAPCEIAFTNASKNAKSFRWDFADGNFSTEMNPKHTYQSAGFYEVKLTVNGKYDFYKYAIIKEGQESASADFDVEGGGCNAPCEVKFINKSVQSDSYKWDFDDGKISTEKSPSHIFEKAGNYKVSLQATGPKGTLSAEKEVIIEAPLITLPAIVWDKSFGGNGEDILVSVIATEDNGLLLGGYSDSPGSGNKSAPNYGGYDFYIVKISKDGSKIWDKTYGGNENDFLRSMLLLPDGGILLGGESMSAKNSGNKSAQDFGLRDFWYVKIDQNGNKIWDKSFGGSGEEVLYSMALNPDGSVVLAGSGPSGNVEDIGDDAYLMKIDSNGDRIWVKRYGSSLGSDIFSSILASTNGDLFIAGLSNSDPSESKTAEKIGNFDCWLVKVDANGNKFWDKTFGGTGLDQFNSVIEAPDGNLLLGGTSLLTNPANFDMMVLKVDKNGNKLLDYPLTMPGAEYFGTLTISQENNLFISGLTTVMTDSKPDILLSKADLSGKIIWTKTISNSTMDGRPVVLTRPNSDIIVGASFNSTSSGDKTAPSYGGTDYWVLKLR